MMLEPSIILDATAKLSSFILGTELSNVKDVADASQEHIASLSLVISDTFIATMKGVESLNILEAVPFRRVGGAFQSLLESNQDLKLSSNAYVSKLVTDLGVAVAQPFNQYLSNNPELSHTTTDYLADVYQDFLPKYKEFETTVGGGPLVRGYEKFITELPSNYENLMNSVLKKSTILTDIGEKFSQKSDILTSSLTDKINGNFNNFLDSNPELRMSTSTYARTKIDTEFLPKFEETAGIVGKSPFITSTKELASKSTSDLTSSFVTDFQQRFSPILTPIGEVGSRVVSRVTSPINEAIGGLNTQLEASRSSVMAEMSRIKPIDHHILSDKGVYENLDAPGSTTGVSKSIVASLPFSLPSLRVDIIGILGAVKNSLQAGQVNLASEFGEAGQVLGGNVMRATDVTGQITEDIIAKSGSLAVDASEGLREILGGLTAAPNRVKSIAASTPSALQDLATATWGSTNHITDRLGAALTSNAESSLAAIQNWSLFSDKNHWENGYWEKIITEVQNTDFQNTDFIQNPNILLSQVTEKLSMAGDRFTSHYELSKSQTFHILGLNANAASSTSGATYDYSRNIQTFNDNVKYGWGALGGLADGIKGFVSRDLAAELITNEFL
eukprot:CAMPEP_0119035164 /NCGR_PEP_ID=MMETSP1177-20130426/2117_1 /TAXON_ID=2985 /ORGANISM="Ochromonas sp, Strain CCMP1899" /LENGTH=615 /DNA_ID=CAMNT_0006993115 /DNA_START=266 /DNA_END=2113 /DNA_ORIENTATION=+